MMARAQTTPPMASHAWPLGLGERASDEIVWVNAHVAATRADLMRKAESARRLCVKAGVAPGETIVTPGGATLDALAWLFGAAAAGAVVVPLRPEREGEIAAWLEFLEIGWRVDGGRIERVGRGAFSEHADRLIGVLRSRAHPGLVLATGGTTGTPKLVLHDLAALFAAVPVREGRPLRTLPLMRFDHIGGLDMAWRALAGGQVLVEPPAELLPEAVAATVAEHGVEAMAATPSFLGLMLAAGVRERHDLSSLRVVPYGAEPMPAGLLARLREAFPRVDFVQRFGTSETGALPAKGDGGGLRLNERADGYAWKIVEGELWVKSPARALGYLSGGGGGFAEDGWFRTGDIAERTEDGGVRVLGRRDELINVGGEKVMASTVESVLLRHQQVADCRVTGMANALLGQVVFAEIVWRGAETDVTAVKRRLHAFAANALPRCHLPAVVRLVAALEATRNLKKVRHSTS